MRPDVARNALLATHGGLSLGWCAVICNLSPMALYRLVCAFGHHSLVTVLTRCGLPLPRYMASSENRRKNRTPDTVWQLLSQLSDFISLKNRHCELGGNIPS
jgi:hypothetical protein